MSTAVARAKRLPVAPRKMRLVANLIRGKKVADALDILQFTTKLSGPLLRKILASAVANAESAAAEKRERIDTDEMIVSHIRVDGGPTLRRFRAAARGRAVRIRKRSAHVELMITEK